MLVSCLGTFIAIIFLYQLGQYLQDMTLSSASKIWKRAIKIIEGRVMNCMYLVFMYVGVTIVITIFSHRYLYAWVMSLYGQLPLNLMMHHEDSFL